MSSLADFVNEHRSKSTRTSFNVANIGTKVSNSFNGFFKINESDDCETLTDKPSTSGQLPFSKNRKFNGWFSTQSDLHACGLSKIQRIFIFFIFLFGSIFCFTAAIMLLPVLIIQTRKFAVLNTLGSIFFVISFGFLLGPVSYIQFLFMQQRRIVTFTYFFSVILTLYTSLWLQNTILTIFSSCIQAASLFWYLMTYIPGGETGLKFMAKLSTSMCSLKSVSTSQSSKLVLPI